MKDRQFWIRHARSGAGRDKLATGVVAIDASKHTVKHRFQLHAQPHVISDHARVVLAGTHKKPPGSENTGGVWTAGSGGWLLQQSIEGLDLRVTETGDRDVL